MVYIRCFNTSHDAIPFCLVRLCSYCASDFRALFLEEGSITVPKYPMLHLTSGYRNDPIVLVPEYRFSRLLERTQSNIQ